MVDIEKLISEMTLAEKISLLAGKDMWHTVPVPRLGIPSIKMTDGPNGARGAWGNMGPTSACTPVGVALGSTWNTDLVERVGGLLAEEVKAKGAHILLAPTVNIHRSPVAGRNFECYSEDPYLSGQLAAAYIKGIQNHGAGACIKHFVCNEQEYERHTMSSQVEERPLHEIYLEPFRLAIRASKPWAVMSAYNKVNGENASENDLTLKTVLKEGWGFDGMVVSDWFGTYTTGVPAGGLDLEMPGPGRWMRPECVEQALQSGALSSGELYDKVRRILRTIERAGAFERPELALEASVDRPDQRALIREAARESIVLLTNHNVLPLKPAEIKTIGVIGELARWPTIMGGGSSQVTPHYVVSPLEGIRNRLGDQVKVEYEVGCFIHKSLPAPEPGCLRTYAGAPGFDLALYDNLDFSGEPAYSEVTTRLNYGWFEDCVPNVNQERFCLRLNGFFTPKESGLHTFQLSSLGKSRLKLDGQLLMDNWSSPVPFSQANTQFQMEAGCDYAVEIEYCWAGNRRFRSLQFGHLPPQGEDQLARAVALAERADAIILVAGLTGEWESESYDRVNMLLPGPQDQLIEQVTKANPNTVVVLNAGSALAMPWIDQAGAVVQQWYNSQECGNALADVLFGDVNPSGKLPTTFPKRLEDNPAYINFPGENGKVLYGEGLFVGYRYYDKKDVDPLFPFGHGLSYTQFEYSRLQLNAERFHAEQGIDLSFDLSNTGPIPGKEIVQLYVRDVKSSVVRPEKELKAFAKLTLEPGETRTVSFHLDKEAFWFYNPAQGGWQVEAGEFEILIGSSSRQIHLRSQVHLEEVRKADDPLHNGMTLRQILADELGEAVLRRHFGDMVDAVEAQGMLEYSLEQIAQLSPMLFTPELMAEISQELLEASE